MNVTEYLIWMFLVLVAKMALQPGLLSPALRSPTTPLGLTGMGGAPIILAPRLPQVSNSGLLNGAPPPLVSAQMSPADGQGLFYGHYDPYQATAMSAAAGLASPTLLEYGPSAIEQSTAGMSYFR